jgi:hypothetical protein
MVLSYRHTPDTLILGWGGEGGTQFSHTQTPMGQPSKQEIFVALAPICIFIYFTKIETVIKTLSKEISKLLIHIFLRDFSPLFRFVDHNRIAFWEGNSFSKRILHFHKLPFTLSLADSTLPKKALPKQSGLSSTHLNPNQAPNRTRPTQTQPARPDPT